ncbi:phosphotransferase family protein [Cellulomonas sp. NPDC055163]
MRSTSVSGGRELEEARDDIVTMLARRYGRAGTVTLAPVAGGLWNLVLSVDSTHGSFVYKRYRAASPPGFARAPASAVELFRTAVAVHRLAPSAGGLGADVPELLEVSPDRLSVLMRAAPGEPLTVRLQGTGPLPSTALLELARWLARYHRLTFGVLPEFAGENSLERYKRYKTQMQYGDVAGRLSPAAGGALQSLSSRYASQRTCLVHGDLNSANVLVGGCGARVTVFDFEQAHVGSPAFDIAYLLAEVVVAAHERGATAALAREFLCAYQDEWGEGAVSEQDVTEHLAGQILYRFWGPSRARWTAYTSPTTRSWFEARCERVLAHAQWSLAALDVTV